MADRKIALTLDGKARAWLASAGYDPVYGARPLKRVIQKALQDPLAQLILKGEIADGSAVAVSADEHGLTLNGVSFASGDASPAHRPAAAPVSRRVH